MKKDGLLKEPEFDNIDKYLQEGNRTKITPTIQKITEIIKGETDGIVLRNILVWMHTKTKRLEVSPNDEDKSIKLDQKKFKRSADEILRLGERTGCCDSSTLFTAFARSKKIPSIQIITLDPRKNSATRGHFFTACYISDSTGNKDWYIIDPDRKVLKAEDVHIGKFEKNNRNIKNRFYAYAYVNDYSELGIDSSEKMKEVQSYAYDKCDKSDFYNEIERE